MIVGNEITAEIAKYKIQPMFLYNDLFEKNMYYWGMLFGISLWSHNKPKGVKMPEQLIKSEKLSKVLEEEFKAILTDAEVEGAAQAVVDYAVYLAEKATEAAIANRPDLVESFKQSAQVRAYAMKLKLHRNIEEKIISTAGLAVRIVGGALL
jgi:hypothetical protein